MEIPLPNFESLEKRIKQLSEEVARIRERQHQKGDSFTISGESRKKIEEKISNLLDLLREF